MFLNKIVKDYCRNFSYTNVIKYLNNLYNANHSSSPNGLFKEIFWI